MFIHLIKSKIILLYQKHENNNQIYLYLLIFSFKSLIQIINVIVHNHYIFYINHFIQKNSILYLKYIYLLFISICYIYRFMKCIFHTIKRI